MGMRCDLILWREVINVVSFVYRNLGKYSLPCKQSCRQRSDGISCQQIVTQPLSVETISRAISVLLCSGSRPGTTFSSYS